MNNARKHLIMTMNKIYSVLLLLYGTIVFFRITGHLGSGQFGSVEKGILQTTKGPVGVAVKTIGPKVSEEDKIKFLQEAAIMGQFKHPNIIQLHGMVTVGQLVSINLSNKLHTQTLIHYSHN